MENEVGPLFGINFALITMKIRTGTATSNGLGLPLGDPIRGVPNSIVNKFFLSGSLYGSHPPHS